MVPKYHYFCVRIAQLRTGSRQNFLGSKHVLKVYFKPNRKNLDFGFLPLPSVQKNLWSALLIFSLLSKWKPFIHLTGCMAAGWRKHCCGKIIENLQLSKVHLRVYFTNRYRQRFFDRVGHETIDASSGNKHFFTK